MNRQQLQCFVCVADKLNFTKAAEELYLSTPTVTHHIKNLEEELQTLLFVRTSRMVQLTNAGTMFYSDAKEILSKMELAEKKVQNYANQSSSFLKIGCSSNAELPMLAYALQQLKMKYPQVYPQIVVQDYFQLKNLFNNKQIDVVLATKEMTKDMQECSFKSIKEVINYAIVSKDYTNKEKKFLLFEDLIDECLITLHPKFVPFQYGDKLQEKITLHTQTHFDLACEHDQAAILLASCGYGVAILPSFCVPTQDPSILSIPILNGTNPMQYGIAYHKQAKSDYIKFFTNEVVQSLEETI